MAFDRWFTLGTNSELPVLLRYARALTRDDAAAEDLVHDALVRAYDRRCTFRRGASLRSWLLSIVHNSFVSAKRRAAFEQRRAEQAARFTVDREEPSQEASARLAAVAQAFASLPEEQRAVLHLVGVEGLTYAEAAATLDVPIGTVMSRLSRARTALRESEAVPRAIRPVGLKLVGGRD